MFLAENWENNSRYGYRYRRYVQALRCGSAVYLRTLKCASTFFYNNFHAWGWEEINFSDIDWGRQHVFSHMLDPIQRRHKAVAEFISMTGTSELLFENTAFQDFVSHVPLLDNHSVSYHDFYGNRAWLIDWIPLSSDHGENIAVTEKLLSYSPGGILKFNWNYDLAHVGDSNKKHIEHKLIELWNQPRDSLKSNSGEFVDFYLERDRILYQEVLKKFSRDQQQWPKISWLRDRLMFQ